jgi:hypothetical protein
MPARGVLSRLLVLHFSACATVSTTSSGSTSSPVAQVRFIPASPGFSNSAFINTKYDSIEGFTKKYQCHRLVYYESYQDVQKAIDREKQIKRWRREKEDLLDREDESEVAGPGRKLGTGNPIPGTVLGVELPESAWSCRYPAISPLLLRRSASSSSVEMTDLRSPDFQAIHPPHPLRLLRMSSA